jgi:hypothetical protein
MLAYDEIVERHHGGVFDNPIRLILNIGTGSGAIVTRNEAGHGLSNIRNYLSQRARYFRYLTQSLNRWTDSRRVEYDMQRLALDKLDYFRLNVQEGLQNMNLDEWKKDGSTLATIEAHTRTYLALDEIQSILRRVARQLVDARKARERFWSPEKKQVITQIWT